MLASIIAAGLASGAIYALVGVTYNTMFSTSRVMSFTAGQLAMLGGVFGSMFTLKMGLPAIVGFALTLVCCAIIGIITEFIAARLLNMRASMPVETLQTTITSAPASLARSMSGVMSG